MRLNAGIFLGKAVIFVDITRKKTPVQIFRTDAENGWSNPETRFPQEKNKKLWNVFCSKTETIIYWNLCLTKIGETKSKIQFNTNQTDFLFSFPPSPDIFVGKQIVGQLHLRYFHFDKLNLCFRFQIQWASSMLFDLTMWFDIDFAIPACFQADFGLLYISLSCRESRSN